LVVSSAYKNGANDGIDVVQDGFLSRKDGGQSGKDEIQSRTNKKLNG
jgi:hypothetical protein